MEKKFNLKSTKKEMQSVNNDCYYKNNINIDNKTTKIETVKMPS